MWRIGGAAFRALLLSAATAAAAAAQTRAGGDIAARARFGGAVAIGEDEVLAGEAATTLRPGTVYLYRRTSGGWAEAAQIRRTGAAAADGFGSAIAYARDRLLIGAATQDERRGAAYLFERRGSGFVQVAQLNASDAEPGAEFGAAVALLGDVALVGAPNRGGGAGAVYVFRRSGTAWAEVARLTASADGAALFGIDLSLAPGRLFVGAPGHAGGRGAIFVFDRTADTDDWQQSALITAPGRESDARFGHRFAVAGNSLIVGAPGAGTGTVHIFQHDGTSGWEPQGRLVGFDAVAGDEFGADVALDGAQLWVGAPGANGSRGASYHFTRDADGIAFRSAQRLLPAVPLAQGALFGTSIAVQAGVAVIGMAGDDNQAGSVIVFERVGDEWAQRAVLKSPHEALASVTGGAVRCTAAGHAAGFGCRDVDLLSFLAIPDLGGGRGTVLNDVWGWTDPQTGREYALVGRSDGTSFVDVTEPTRPVYIGDLPMTEGSSAAFWRDVKVYRDHAFIVADGAGSHGVQVFDLKRLREFRGAPLGFTPDHVYRRVNSAHNIAINEETGFAYSVGGSGGGETCGGGLHMIDVREPTTPRFAGCFADPQTGRAATGYSHDVQCVLYRGPDTRYQRREICFGSNETALSIADVTDKSQPRALARASYPNVGYSHQGWLSADQRYFFMNDELDEIAGSVSRTRTLIWDVADLEDPRLAGQYAGATAASDHNLFIRDNLMYQSNYRAGLRIIDIADPLRPREIAFFDTAPYGDDGPGFDGSWSNYPFFRSGIILVSSIGEGLFVLRHRGTAAQAF